MAAQVKDDASRANAYVRKIIQARIAETSDATAIKEGNVR